MATLMTVCNSCKRSMKADPRDVCFHCSRYVHSWSDKCRRLVTINRQLLPGGGGTLETQRAICLPCAAKKPICCECNKVISRAHLVCVCCYQPIHVKCSLVNPRTLAGCIAGLKLLIEKGLGKLPELRDDDGLCSGCEPPSDSD
jgi:hypothetical protein